MKKSVTILALVSIAALGVSCTSVYPTRTVYRTTSGGGGGNVSVKDPVRSPGKNNPDNVEPIRTPSSYSY